MMSNKSQLTRTNPEEQGISSSAILRFLEAAEESKQELHSFMLLRRGHVVAEGWWSPYGPERPHMLFSLSKSFTSTAIGLAVAEGLLSVDDPVLSFFPQDVTDEMKENENLASMRVRHLLSMSTGHAEDTMGSLGEQQEESWVKGFLNAPVDYPPGTHFVYNSGASYMLSAIVQQVTRQTLLEYLRPRLFEPLGIEGAAWEICPQGINTGGWGLSIRTEDIARFGQMYLRKGIWNGKRILSETWVEEATASHISNGDGGENDWTQGYGYQFWRCRHGAYRGDGAFGQYCVVMPDQDAVIAITSGVDDMQKVLNLIWEHLLPAMGSASLPHNVASQALLEQKLAALALYPPQEQPSSSIAINISGKRYEIENKDKVHAVSFDFKEDSCVFTLWNHRGEHHISCGIGDWLEGETTMPGNPCRVAASGMWRDRHTYVMTWRFVETPFYDTLVCHFEEDRLRVESSTNVSFGPRERPPLLGRMV